MLVLATLRMRRKINWWLSEINMASYVQQADLWRKIQTVLCTHHNVCRIIPYSFFLWTKTARPRIHRMINRQSLFLLPVVSVLMLGACKTRVETMQAVGETSPCHIIYDAGSSETRLFIYQEIATGWVRHRGPRSGALADPVRGLRGKTMLDAPAVVDEMVAALFNIRRDGPANPSGQPEWPAFDWQKYCRVEVASVYATAGMRLAEQQDTEASELIWKMLNNKLSGALGMAVTTRTLTAYEEGLFAWLAIREGQGDDDFGVADMGGASLQVTLPCQQCKTSRLIKVKDHLLPLYSYSFLGWGQDEAWKKLGPLPSCARGAGRGNPDWRTVNCSNGMEEFSDAVSGLEIPAGAGDNLHWYLNGAFQYMESTDIDRFCRKGIDSGFEPATACFRAVYLQHVINMLGLPAGFEKTGVGWTLGAVICMATRCLEIQ
jgi:hypothetical protein